MSGSGSVLAQPLLPVSHLLSTTVPPCRPWHLDFLCKLLQWISLAPCQKAQQGTRISWWLGTILPSGLKRMPSRIRRPLRLLGSWLISYVGVFSPLDQLHSDQGKQFESEVMKEVCDILGIKKSRTSPYHPQCDGLVEHSNRTLLSMLATTTQSHLFDWEDQLPKVCMAYNTSVHASTGYTPFFLMYGRQARLPIDLVYGTKVNHTHASTYATSTKRAFEEAYSLVRQKLNAAHCIQKTYYDKKVHGKPFVTGDLVWLFSPAVPRGKSKKSHHPWSGPYRVTARLGDSDYRVKKLTGRRTVRVVHFNRLKSCNPATRWVDLDPTPSTTPPTVDPIFLGKTCNYLMVMLVMTVTYHLEHLPPHRLHHPLYALPSVLVTTPTGMGSGSLIEFEDKFFIEGVLCRTDNYCAVLITSFILCHHYHL